MTALAFRAGCVELIAGQFQSQGQKISQHQIHLQNLRGFSWLVKNRAEFGSVQNTRLLERFFARTELLALAGVDSLVLVGQNRHRGKTRSSSVVVREFCSLLVRIRRCRTVSSSVRWKLVSYRFLWTTPAVLSVFLRSFTNALMLYLPQ